MKNTISFLRNLPKRVALTAAALVVSVSSVAGPLATASAMAGNVRIEGQVQVANVTAGDTGYKDSVNAMVDDVVKVQVWYHNKENHDSGKVAKNLKVGINIPTTAGKSQTIAGKISADNSNTVNDNAQVNLSLDNAYLEYVEGSAKWRHNKGAAEGRKECQTGAKAVPTNDPHKCYVTETISDQIVKSGTGLKLEDLEPCFAHEATVTVLMRVKADAIKVNKYVSHHDGDSNVKNNDWTTKNSAKPGDKLDYMIRFENKGNTTLNNVVVGDNLPDYLEYVPGSTVVINGNNPNGIAAGTDNVYNGGIRVGNYKPGAAGYVVFTVRVNDMEAFEKCGTYTLKNVGVVRPEGMNEYYNTAWTDVSIECKEGEKPQPPTPGPEKPEKPEKPQVPEMPKELPSTGPGSVLAGLASVSALGYCLSAWLQSRRGLASTRR